MLTTRIKMFAAALFAVTGLYTAYPQSAVRDIANALDAYADKSREQREQDAAPARIKEILALAKKSAEEDFNVNFCGFFTGMSRHDALALAEYYRLKDGEYSMDAAPGKAVSGLWFSLKGVRRVTKGGNTLDELAQAVANRVGDLKRNHDSQDWKCKTIGGIVVTFGGKGLSIQNVQVAYQTPLATAEAAQKDKADAANLIPLLIRDMVAIPGKDFKMGKFEVTQVQWQAVMGYNPSKFKRGNNPVECVSWNGCKRFLAKLNARPEVKASGLTFRLPTEAEWEYACRAGSTGDYCKLADGTEITESTLGEVAWYDKNSEKRTHPVGQKKPNAFGLYDMHGNVWEWCKDLYRAGGSYRVNRGGGWNGGSGDCAAGLRYCGGPDGCGDLLGFRLAASQDVNR